MTRAAAAGGAALLLLLAAGHGAARAQTPPPALDDPAAFERGFAVSLFQFDACGDAVAGRAFRRALAERVAHCPFTPGARARYAERTRAQFQKARERMAALVEETGGLPVRLEGMSATCRQQRASEEYRLLRARLERYAEGAIAADAVIPAPCDAADVLP